MNETLPHQVDLVMQPHHQPTGSTVVRESVGSTIGTRTATMAATTGDGNVEATTKGIVSAAESTSTQGDVTTIYIEPIGTVAAPISRGVVIATTGVVDGEALKKGAGNVGDTSSTLGSPEVCSEKNVPIKSKNPVAVVESQDADLVGD